MSVYCADASEGDVLKSQDDFAILSRDASGNLVWKGTLRYLEAGRGYMLKRTADNDAKFYYPCYYSESRYSSANTASRRTTLFENNSATSMNIVACVSGLELQAGDRLVVFNGTSRVGVAEASEDGLFYLNVSQSDDDPRRLTFCLERDGQVVSITGSVYCYSADAVIGSPEQAFEQTMSVSLLMQHELEPYVTTQDLICATIGDEVRGLTSPVVEDGLIFFPLTVAANGKGENVKLSYYCERLHRIFTIPWTTFDASVAPMGEGGIYRPQFVTIN